MIEGMDDLLKKLSSLQNIDIKGKDKLKNFLEDWIETELPDIINTGGRNIGLPLRKKTSNTMKFRKYNLPFKNVAGIFRGSTYFSLANQKNVDDITNIKKITDTELVYGFFSKKVNFINFNVGVSKKFLDAQNEKIIKNISKEIDKKL